ncbi:hypothetical protein [Paenibacillus odorifer]|nr:hypothetical protein [Paenibacillus odorifer]
MGGETRKKTKGDGYGGGVEPVKRRGMAWGRNPKNIEGRAWRSGETRKR